MKAINNNNEVAIKTFIFYCKKRKEYTQEILLLIKREQLDPQNNCKARQAAAG